MNRLANAAMTVVYGLLFLLLIITTTALGRWPVAPLH